MKKPASRSAQYPLMAEFAFSFNEYVQDSADQVKKTFGCAVTNTGTATAVDPVSGAIEPGLTGPVANTIVFDAIPMPIGAVITGGELIVETAWATSTAATASLGIVGTLTGLLNASDLKAAAGTRVALTLTAPLLANAGQNLRLTMAYTVAAATAGKARLRVFYTIDGRTSEIQIT